MAGATSGFGTRLLSAGLVAAACTAPALAQSGQPDTVTTRAPSGDPATRRDDVDASRDIVVTAQKRTERALDVPISLAVAQGETLRNLNLNAATDLQYVAPGLGLGDANTPRGAGFRVRGVGTNVFADGIEQSVGTVVDGVPLARAGQGLADLIDVERVEVLRGPQGMLFGRNASAGLINIVTRRPSDALTFEALGSYGTDDDIRSAATVSGPLASGLGARVTGFYNRQDGFVRDLRSGRDLNNRNEYGVRGVLEFSPADSTDIAIRADWSKRDNRASIWTIRALPSNALRPILDPRIIAAVGLESRLVNLSGEIYNTQKNWGVSGEINHEFGDYTLTSITAYRKFEQADNNDADQSLLNVLDLNRGTNDLRQFSQELRVTSPNDRFLSFVAGAFYYNSRNRNLTDQVGKFAVSLAQAGAAGIPLFGGLIQPSALGGREVAIQVDVEDIAAFGQATLNISPQFRAIVGGRFTHTKVGATYNRRLGPGASAGFNAVLGAAFAPLAYDLQTKDDNISWRLGLQYQPGHNHNLYATVSRGYKGPGFDTQVDFTVQPGRTAFQSALVNPEIATNYEVGYKASVLDRRLDFSVAAYLTDFRDFQAQVFETPASATIGSFRIRNAGKLRSKGFELEFTARPTEGLSAGIGLAYNETRFKRFTAASCPRLGQTVAAPNNGLNCGSAAASFDASGLQATNAPRWTVSANARYEADITDNVGAFAQANAYLRSDNVFGLYPSNITNPTQQDGYAIVNGTVGVSFAQRRVTLAAFVRNLFDTNFVTSIFDLPFGGAGDLGQFSTLR